MNTTFTTATCREVQLTSNAQTCEFRVQTIVCNTIASTHSNSMNIVLPPGMLSQLFWMKTYTIINFIIIAMGIPTVEILSKYQQSTTCLVSFMTVIDKIVNNGIENVIDHAAEQNLIHSYKIYCLQAPISISGINVSIQYFTINYVVGGSVCESEVIKLSDQACSLMGNPDKCRTEYNVTSSRSQNCTIDTGSDYDITVTVTATSDLETGQESQSRVGQLKGLK